MGFTQGMDHDGFLSHELTNNAVVLQLLIIGEATKRLSDSFRQTHAHIPWQQMAGMRDRLVHGYDRWNLDEVWDVVTIDLPKLLTDLEPLVQKPEGDQA